MNWNLVSKIRNLSENNREVLKNIIAAFVVKGLSLIISLFTMPTYIRFFSDEVVLGLWFTILSVLNWILTFDFGIGNGLRNKLTMTIASGDAQQSKRYLSSAYIVIGALCIIISAIFIFIADFINWNSIFNIEEQIVSEKALLYTVKIVFIGIILQMFFKLITSVLYALQKSSVNNVLSLISTIITLLCVNLIPSSDNDKNMICMAFVHVLAVILPLVVCTLIVFNGKNLKGCTPSWRFFSKEHSKGILSLGGAFLFVQIAYMVIMNTNEYLISTFYHVGAVVDYQIYYKYFALCGTMFSLAMTPIWSAVTKAVVQKNFDWIRKLYKILLIASGIGLVVEFAMMIFLQPFVNVWLGSSAIITQYDFGVPFALLGSFILFNTAVSSIANGLGELRTQVVFFGIGAIIKIPISWLLVTLSQSWIGVVWATDLVLGVYCIVQGIVLKRKLFNDERIEQ